ncbi:uncharacterized protein LOC111370137 [Olea europaea var. sylvestris]|uniref:uncharacterized protein LOC111370137 n=1 Tax=Olea europaea var. sylvestris TaxID=158386 RepID=UPI000C1D7095|nr:uncharacterized protein LOC111370137 [Olea europaea var. sylvestris]
MDVVFQENSIGNESQTETNNQEVGALDLKGINLDPSGDELLEAEVMVVPQSEGIPRPTYELELSNRVKYPLSHYVSNQHLLDSNQSFINQLSVLSIPNSVQEALADLRQQRRITTLIFCVDDMVVIRNDTEEMKALQEYLFREFEIKDLGLLKYFPEIEVSRSNKGNFLSRRKYALDLLHETRMLACQLADTLVEEGLKLCIEVDQVPVDKGKYQRLVG